MFGMGTQEILIVLAVALIFIGPKKLPEIARTLGRGFGELRRAANDLRGQIDLDTMMEEPEEGRQEESNPSRDLDTLYEETRPVQDAPFINEPEGQSPTHEQEKDTVPEKAED